VQSQYPYRRPIDRAQDDLLLNAKEITEAWEISDWALRKLVREGKLRRARRPNFQPYYTLSAVVAVLGEPIHSPTPRYHSGGELQRAA
jgi:hypothetical protein